ncbi:MAG TPA: hypothetical protein VN915_03530 [Elusimicrobiota bacterium]|nr:hypothetical protein [Elusimicrobiota bacterium]
MKRVRFGTDDERRREGGEEDANEHERNRRIKSERDRLMRRELARLRSAGAEEELEDGLSARA